MAIQYRKRAAEAREIADKTADATTRQSWADIATQWELMAKAAERGSLRATRID